MKMMKAMECFVGLTAIAILSACGGSTTTSNISSISTTPGTTAVSLVARAVKTSGAGLAGGSSLQSLLKSDGVSTMITPAACNQYGFPVVNQSDGNYPGHLVYCFMTVDAGDTILGGFGLARGLTCMLEKAGIVFDGTQRSMTLAIDGSDTTCWPGNNPGAGTMTVNVTGSSPAAFNTNYSKGIEIVTPDGLTFKLGFNVSASAVSFITHEYWIEGTGGANGFSEGATAGTLDKSTGDLRYESRVERAESCTVTSGRCGWNRHTRIYSKLNLDSSGEPTGVQNFSFAYSNIQATPGQSGFGGVMVTASGALSTGVKARLWQTSSVTSLADYLVRGNWTEVANSACFSSTSDTAVGCDSGLDHFTTNGAFTLGGTRASGSHTLPAAWFGSRTGQTYTSVNRVSSLDSGYALSQK